MRIQFLCLYFLSYVLIADEIPTNFLLGHYSLKNHSIGIGMAKENIGSQKLFGWFHSGKEISPSLGINLQLFGKIYKQNIQFIHPITNELTNIPFRSEQIINISPGIRYEYFYFYTNLQSVKPAIKDFSLGIDLFSDKSLFLFYRENSKENTKTYAFSIISGRIPTFGLSVAKDYYAGNSEWLGSISLSFQFESYQAGVSHSINKDREENSFLLSNLFHEKTKPLFEKESNPYWEEDNTTNKKSKEWDAKKFTKKERIIYEIKIEELLKFRIPLVVAIRIAKASKSKEDYTELLKILPRDVVRKCNKIQYDKSKAHP